MRNVLVYYVHARPLFWTLQDRTRACRVDRWAKMYIITIITWTLLPLVIYPFAEQHNHNLPDRVQCKYGKKLRLQRLAPVRAHASLDLPTPCSLAAVMHARRGRLAKRSLPLPSFLPHPPRDGGRGRKIFLGPHSASQSSQVSQGSESASGGSWTESRLLEPEFCEWQLAEEGMQQQQALAARWNVVCVCVYHSGINAASCLEWPTQDLRTVERNIIT